MTTHKVIDGYTRESITVRTVHQSGLYSVSKLKVNWHRYMITHVPTGLTMSGSKKLSEAIKIADALDRAFKSTGKGVRWGDSQTLTIELNSVNNIVKICASARETNE